MLEKEIAHLMLSMGPLMDIKFFRAVHQQLKPGFSPLQIRILFMLRHNGGTPMTVLAEELRMPKQQLTPLIDRLYSEGLVARNSNPGDRRVVNVELSECGRIYINQHDDNVKEIFAAKLRQLDEADLRKLYDAFYATHEVLAKIS